MLQQGPIVAGFLQPKLMHVSERQNTSKKMENEYSSNRAMSDSYSLEKNSIDFEKFSGFICVPTTNSRFSRTPRLRKILQNFKNAIGHHINYDVPENFKSLG